MAAQTLFEKIWNEHVVMEKAGQPVLLYIDLHLIHEVTSPQAFEAMRVEGRKVRVPGRTEAIEYETSDGKWHTETAAGGDRPDTDVEDTA